MARSADLGGRIGTVIHDPLGRKRHDVDDPPPAAIAGRKHRQQRLEQGEGLAVVLAGLGPPQRFAERADGLVVARIRGLHDVAGGCPVPARLDQHPGHVTVQGPPAGAADLVVDGLLDQRVGDLVEQFPPVLDLRDQAHPLQAFQDRAQIIQRTTAQPQQIAQFRPIADDGEQLQHGPVRAVEA